MGRRRDFEEERRRQQMRVQGVENVEETCIREGLGPEIKGQKDISSKKPPREKFTLIRRFSEEGEKLVARGIRQLKLPLSIQSQGIASRRARPLKKRDP